MSRTTVADFVIDHLADWGVTRIFGYSGDSINPVVSALNRTDQPIKFIQGRHEEMCAFMACGHAKFTGQAGVCLATSGPGAIHLLNGLYDAKMDNQPVLAIVGQQARTALGSSYIQDVDLLSLFKDVAHQYVNVASSPEQVRHLIDRSMMTSYSKRTVTCLILPHDVQTAIFKGKLSPKHGETMSGICHPTTAVIPPLSDIEQAAKMINSAERPAILVGAGALHARDQVVETAVLLGAGIAKALLGKAAVEDNLPFVTGCIGLLGTEASSQMMKDCDLLLVVGSNFPYAEYLPNPDKARGVQIDLEAANISLHFPMEVGLIGDSAETMKLLLSRLRDKGNTEWRRRIYEWVRNSEESLVARTRVESSALVNPERVYFELSSQLPNNAIITCDSGTSTVWFARHLKIRPAMMASVSGGLASMGCSVPYAIAAKFAYPGRPVIVCTGDGAMQMSGNNELLTVAKYWKEWQDPRMVIVVLKNNDLNFVTWEMRAVEGDPRYGASQDLPDFSYAQYARNIGLDGLTISNSADIVPMLAQALASERPMVVEVLSDPNIPPIPPTVTMEVASLTGIALLKEGPEGADAIWGSVKQVWNSLTGK